jgi:hypothetical protein
VSAKLCSLQYGSTRVASYVYYGNSESVDTGIGGSILCLPLAIQTWPMIISFAGASGTIGFSMPNAVVSQAPPTRPGLTHNVYSAHPRSARVTVKWFQLEMFISVGMGSSYEAKGMMGIQD